MKVEMRSVLRRMENDLTASALQVPRIAPALRLISARNTRKLRIPRPSRPARGLTLDDRKLTAARREAEMFAWQVTGGDVLLSE
jgi:hypothetical protein